MKFFVTFFAAFILGLFPMLALADVGALSEAEFGLIMTALQWVAGEYAILVVLVLFSLGFLWAQLRTIISPEKMAKLPKWLIVPLEYIAANRGHAQNELNKDPLKVKAGG